MQLRNQGCATCSWGFAFLLVAGLVWLRGFQPGQKHGDRRCAIAAAIMVACAAAMSVERKYAGAIEAGRVPGHFRARALVSPHAGPTLWMGHP